MTKLIIGVYFHLKSINKKEGFYVILSKHTCWNHKCFWKLVLVIINPCDVRIFSMSLYMISLTICLYLKSEVFFILKDLLLSSFTFQEIFFCKTHVSIKQLYEKKLVFSFSFSFFFFFFLHGDQMTKHYYCMLNYIFNNDFCNWQFPAYKIR